MLLMEGEVYLLYLVIHSFIEEAVFCANMSKHAPLRGFEQINAQGSGSLFSGGRARVASVFGFQHIGTTQFHVEWRGVFLVRMVKLLSSCLHPGYSTIPTIIYKVEP